MILITVPVCPPANRYWRSPPQMHGQRIRTTEAKRYIKLVQQGLVGRGLVPYHGQELIMVTVWYRDALRGDTSNRLKIIEDALQGIAFTDDKFNGAHFIERRLDREAPRMEIAVAPFNSTGLPASALLRLLTAAHPGDPAVEGRMAAWLGMDRP